ncbi:hypothetical protein LXA43DRAFT_888909 [Ganoderma leucocontextum]|nr:hypothetical protein LXA43DRAFT_888909 [Ganoderma leucocontextum]
MDAEPTKKHTGGNTVEGDSSTQTPTRFDQVQAATRDRDYYWFANDGNLILVSQGVAFRVYKELLAEQSGVFRSMFYTGQATPEEEDLADGCPVVPLDDSPNDLRKLKFWHIYPLSVQRRKGRVDIAIISAGIIRLDHKYQLKGLYEEALSYLTTYYTATSFDAWVDGHNAAQWQPDAIWHAIRAINLARLTNTVIILPTAFYICATLGPDLRVLRGSTLEDGSTEQLTLEDMHLVLEMKARLAVENARTAFLLFRPPDVQVCGPTLSRKAKCGEVRRRLLEHAGLSKAPHPVASERALDSWVTNADSLPVFAPTPGPLGSVALVPGVGWYQPCRLCEACRNHFQARDRELRREVWRRLPEFLGLTVEGWDT